MGTQQNEYILFGENPQVFFEKERQVRQTEISPLRDTRILPLSVFLLKKHSISGRFVVKDSITGQSG